MISLFQPSTPLPKLPPSEHFWMPDNASLTAADIDWLYMFMVWMSVICTVGIFAAMAYFCTKYRAKSRTANEQVEASSDHNTTLEVTWSIIPLFLVIALFVWGFKGFVDLRTPPKDSLEIHAIGKRWAWSFQYPHGADNMLHVPVDRNVRIVIQSLDVLHSLYLPNFRVKMDAVPGRYTDLWFHATKPGDFPIFCAEYCGTSHSDMLSHVIVHPSAPDPTAKGEAHEGKTYDQWVAAEIAKIQEMPPVELGKRVYEKQGCNACHTVDGTPKIGPSWKGMFGRTENLASGGSVKVDENYIRESILDPQAKVVASFPPSMPVTKLSDREITGVIEYLKTLK
jgi:cytochrome c oxidase subunit 2